MTPDIDTSREQVEDGPSGGLLDAAVVLAENLRLLIVLPLLAGLIALAISFFIRPTFTATAKLLPPHQQLMPSAASAALLGAIAGVAGGSLGIKNPADQLVAMLKSQTVNDSIIKRFDLVKIYNVELVHDARKILQTKVRFSASAKDSVITIEVDDFDPKRAAELANGFVEELHRVASTMAVTEAAQRRLFFEQQLAKAKEGLIKAEIALRASGVGEGSLKAEPRSALEAVARLRAQISAQEVRLAAMRTYMTESNPEFRVVLQEIATLKGQLRQFEQNVPQSAGGNGPEYITRFRDFKYHEALFELLLKQYDLARLDEAREGPAVQVMDAALPPERKSRPAKAMIAVVTTFLALVFTCLYLLVRNGLERMARRDAAAAAKLLRLRSLLSPRTFLKFRQRY